MNAHVSIVWVMLLGAAAIAAPNSAPAKEANSRTFKFTYAATVIGLKPNQPAQIWLPIPPGNRNQDVQVVDTRFSGPVERKTEPGSRNEMYSFRANASRQGTIDLSVIYLIVRRAAAEEPKENVPDSDREFFLQSNRMVPVGGKSLTLIEGKTLPEDPLLRGQLLYNLVDDHLEYRKDKPGWGRGDSNWACDSRFGNCTDFHSLFMSLARSQQLPVKFQIGFSIPPQRGKGEITGYHCWAWFLPSGHGWVPVDISEANRHPDKRSYFFAPSGCRSRPLHHRPRFGTGAQAARAAAQLFYLSVRRGGRQSAPGRTGKREVQL